MAEKLITVDIDDVVADSTEAFRVAVNEHTGANLTPEDYKVPHRDYHEYYEHVWKSHGLNVIYDEISLPMQIDQSHVALIAGAKRALGELAKRYRIAFVTSRSISWEDATHLYIGAEFNDLNAGVYFTNKQAGISKGQVCRELGASWHIDDNPEHCQSVLDEGIQAILFGEYGWHHKIPTGAIHCKNWQEVEEYFDGRDG
jgi:FMN phosphatase YigB (HAD superfamily)